MNIYIERKTPSKNILEFHKHFSSRLHHKLFFGPPCIFFTQIWFGKYLEYLNLSYHIWVEFIFVYQKSLKRTFKTSFWVQNHLLNLWSSAMNSQRLLCSKKGCLKMFVLKLFFYTNKHPSMQLKELALFLIQGSQPMLKSLWKGLFLYCRIYFIIPFIFLR